jgi:hypothetical protein
MHVKKNLFSAMGRSSSIPPSLRAPNQREEFAISHRCLGLPFVPENSASLAGK